MNKPMTVLFIVTMLIMTGCVDKSQNDAPKPGISEVNLDPVLLPTQNQPAITEELEGVRFYWPGQNWVLLEDETGLYALASDLTYRVNLEPHRKGVELTPILWFEEQQHQDALEIIEMIPLEKGVLLVTQHQGTHYGLAHLRETMEGQLEWLITDALELPTYVLSQDKTKVVYKMVAEGHLKAYHAVTGRKTPFPELTDDRFCADWTDQINVSPLGGYLTYQEIDCATEHPIQFTIVGADSGRIIRNNLPGIQPVWDHKDQQIVFQLMTGHGTKAEETEKTGKTVPQQLGMYSLQTGEVGFFNRIANGYWLSEYPVFSQDSQYLVYGIVKEAESRLIIHHILQQRQQSMLLPENTVAAETEQWAFMNDQLLALAIKGEAGHQLFAHHIASEFTEVVGPIDHWTRSDGKTSWFSSCLDTGIYYLREGKLMQAKEGNHRPLFSLPKGTKMTDIDEWNHWLLITLETSQGELQLYFIGL